MQWRNAAAPLKVVIPWEKRYWVLHLPPAVFVIQRTTTFFQKKVNFKIFFWRFEFNFSFEFQIRMYYFLQMQPFPTFSTFLWSRNAQLIKISQEYRLLFQFFEAIKFVHDYVAKSIAYFFY